VRHLPRAISASAQSSRELSNAISSTDIMRAGREAAE
jgi:hypothetical protein